MLGGGGKEVIVILNKEIRKCLTDNMTLESRSESGEDINHGIDW